MSTATDKADEQPTPDARLFGMVVHEVSLVDRAANKRKFLMLKRDDPMGKQAVAKDGATDGAAAAAPPAAGAPAAADGDGSASGGDSKLVMQPQVKDQLLAAITAAAEKLVDLANQVKGAETDEKATDPAVPDAILGGLQEAAQTVTGVAQQFGKAGEGAAAGGGQQKDLDGLSANGGVTSQGTTKVSDLLAKRGSKMAKERREKFRKALDLLAGIMKEIDKAAGTPLAKNAAGKAPIPAGHALVPADQLRQLLEGVDTLTKAHAAKDTELSAATARITELEKRTGTPNSAPAEGGGGGNRKPVSWPLDLNQDDKFNPQKVPTAKRVGTAGR